MKIQLSEHFTFKKLLHFVYPSVIMMIFTSIYVVVAESTGGANKEMDYVFALNEEEEHVLESFRNLGGRQKERLLGYMTALQENK